MDIAARLTDLFELRITAYVVVLSAVVISGYSAYRTIRGNGSTMRKYGIAAITAGFFVLYVTATFSVVRLTREVPRVLMISPDLTKEIPRDTRDIRIVFASPVLYDTITVHTFPETEYAIERHGYLRNLVPWGTVLTLKATTTLPPGESIQLYLANIEGPLTEGYGGEREMSLRVADPMVIAVNPPDESTDISVTQTIDVRLSESIVAASEWRVESRPAHAFSVERAGSDILRLHPDDPLQQGVSYTITLMHTPAVLSHPDQRVISRLPEREKARIRLSTVRPALVSGFSPQGYSVNPEDSLSLTFDEPMDPESVRTLLAIEPPTDLSATWNEDYNRLSLVHGGLEKNTNYSVTLRAGARTAIGESLEHDAMYLFRTAGPLMLTDSDPEDKAPEVRVNSEISLTFNQPVSPDIGQYITITPHVRTKISVDNNTVTILPVDGFSERSTYTVQIKKGAPSLYGLLLEEEKSLVFTTTSSYFLLEIPMYHQQTNFTCNIAAARMLLGFRGISVTEQDLISITGLGGKRGSGNPHNGYVDDFGTFWDPVYKAVTAYRPARLIRSGSLTEILTEVANGNPVMTWGQNGWSDPHDISWTSADGTYIYAINGMHSMVVRGYEGTAENPTRIYVNDPWRGQYALSIAEFTRRWKYYYMALVID